MAEPSCVVRFDAQQHADVCVLTVWGVLDGSTYRFIRDTVIKAALDEPRAVLVDVDGLSVPSPSAWVVFTSARWHVSVWPDVPVVLVCGEPLTRRAIVANGVTRYVPVHATSRAALAAMGELSCQLRRRARAELSRSRNGLPQARAAIRDWLTEWRRSEVAPVAATVATVFVENVLDHTDSVPTLIAESFGGVVTVAVEDRSDRLPGLHEDPERGAALVSGLAIVSALSRSWGATPTSTGKTVWAVIGPENRF